MKLKNKILAGISLLLTQAAHADTVKMLITELNGVPYTMATEYFFDTATSSYTNEDAQDAVGTILVDSATVDFTYSDATPSITASVIGFSGTSSGANTGDVTLSAFGSSPNANGASLSGQALTLQPADGTNPGGVSTTTQTFAGNKTFSGTIAASNFSGTHSGTSSGTNTGDQTITLTSDVTGSGTGSFATTIAADAVTNTKLANMATQTFKGRTTALTGDPEDLTVAQAKTMLSLTGTNSGDQTITLTGDVTGSGTGSFAATIANDAVTYAKMQNVSAATRLLGRGSAGGSGDPEELTVSTGLSLSGTALSSTITQYTDELAQDAIGAALTDTASVDFTYNDGANTISAAVLPAGVDHNSLANLTTGDPHTQYMLGAGTVTNNAVAKYSGTGGRQTANSGVIIDASNNVSGIATLNASGAVTFSNYTASRVPFTGTGGLLTVDSALIWDNTGKTLQISDLWLSTDTVSARANDLTLNTQTSGKNIILSPNGTGTVNTTTDVILQNQKSLKLREGTGGGTNFAAFQAPATLAGDYTLTMPTALPASTQALFSSSAGALSFSLVPTYASTFTDNHLIRADGTTGVQDSLGVLSDAGALTGLTGITMGNTTWSNVDVISSTSTFDVTAAGTMTFNSGTGNFNMVAFAGDINAAAENNVVFASNTGSVAMTSGTSLDLTGPSGINLLSDTVLASNNFLMGGSNEAKMFVDTGLVINPKNAGSGVLTIGSATGTSDGDLVVNKLGLFGSAISSTAIVNSIATGAARQSLNFALTFNGAGGTLANINNNLNDQGSSASMIAFAAENVLKLATTSHTTVQHTGLRGQTGIDSTIAIASGTYTFKALEGSPAGQGVGSASTSGGTFRRYGLFLNSSTAIAGAPTSDLIMGIWSPDSINTQANTKLIFDSTSTALGDSYMTYDSGTGENQLYNDGTLAMSWDSDETRTEVKHAVKAGTSSTFAKVGGTIQTNTTGVGNVLTGEDDLITYTVPANILATNGDTLSWSMGGTFAGNVNTKRIKIKYGATTLLDTTALIFNGADWSANGSIIRTGAATQKAITNFSSGSTVLNSTTDYTAPAETLSGTVVFKATGEATLTDDVREELFMMDWKPVQ